MNLSDWIKVAALITQQKQEAATADTDQLSSMPKQQVHQHIWRWIHIACCTKILISK